MYGFPLTIYLVVRVFGLDRNNLNASLWSTLLGMGELGMTIVMIIGYAVALIGIGCSSRAGANSIARTRKTGSPPTGYTVLSDTHSIPDSLLAYSAKA